MVISITVINMSTSISRLKNLGWQAGKIFTKRRAQRHGIMDEIYQVAEWIMFSGFLLIFFVYLWGIRHAWVVLRFVRQKLSLELSE